MDTCVSSSCVSDGCRTANDNFRERQCSAFRSRKAGTGDRLVLFGRSFVLHNATQSITLIVKYSFLLGAHRELLLPGRSVQDEGRPLRRICTVPDEVELCESQCPRFRQSFGYKVDVKSTHQPLRPNVFHFP